MFISKLPRLRADAPPGRAQSKEAGRREKDQPGKPLPAAAAVITSITGTITNNRQQ
jgi:hypothetical protein